MAIAVIVTLAALRRFLRGQLLLKVAVVSAAIALFAWLLLSVLGFALVFSSDSLTRGRGPRDRAVLGLHRPGAVAGHAGLHRPRDRHQLRRRGPRARAHPSAEPVRGNRRRRRGQPPGGDRRRLGLPRGARPERARRRGERPRGRLAPGPAGGHRDGHRRRPPRRRRHGAGGLHRAQRRPGAGDRDRHLPGRSRAPGVLDGPLRDAAPRLRPPRARRGAHRGGNPRRHPDRRLPAHHLQRRGRRGPVPGEPLQLRGAHRAHGRPGRGGATAHTRARARAPVPRAVGCADQRRRRPGARGGRRHPHRGPLGGGALHPRGRPDRRPDLAGRSASSST